MPNNKLHVMVLTLAGDNVYRNLTANSFDEVRGIRDTYRNHPIGLFTEPNGKGEMWMSWPDLAASEAFEGHKARRLARRSA